MNLPRLTAEASLYRFGTHYRTRSRTSLVGSSGSTIRTAQGGTGTQGETGGEIISVHGCLPGEVKVGDQCVLLDPGGTLSSVSVPTGQGPQRPGSGHGGKGHGPHRPGKNIGNGRNGQNYNPVQGGQCYADFSADGNPPVFYGGTYSLNPGGSDGGWACCTKLLPAGTLCAFCNPTNGKSAVCADLPLR